MARRPDDPRYEETRTEPGRRHAAETEPERSRDTGAHESGPGNGHQRTRAEQGSRQTVASDRAGEEARHAAPPAGYGNGAGIAALVVGMLGVTLAFLIFPAVAAVLLGIAAIILGAMGIRNANRLAGLHKGLAVTGLVTGILALLLGAAVIAGGVAIVDQMGDRLQVDELREQLPDGG